MTSTKLIEINFIGQRQMTFKYQLRVEDASSVFDGTAEIINNNSTNYSDVICIDPGDDFWKFLQPRGEYCDWDSLKNELMEKWQAHIVM
ncbi:MAG: hypothetical protein WCP55_03575 [Lentisphaerota bacterium]